MGCDNTAAKEELAWLSADFLEDIIRREEKDNTICVVRTDIKPASSKGDNYVSLLYQVEIDFNRNSDRNDSDDTEKLYLIVKGLPRGEFLQKFVKETKLFEKETLMYLTTMPEMYRLEKEILPELKLPLFSAKGYQCFLPDTLVLENLTKLGYKMADRHNLLDLSHCTLALQALARFHALSVAMAKRDPDCFEGFVESLYNKNNLEVMNFMQPTFNALANVVEKWPGYARFGDKLRKAGSDIVDTMTEIVTPTQDFLSVLNHGDFWVNNMMFNYCPDTGVATDVRLIDFQMSRYASPALDLHYFFFTSIANEQRMRHWDRLLEVYHTALCQWLRLLGCETDVMSLDELKREVRRKAFFGLVASCTVLSAVLADPSEAMELDTITEEQWNTGLESGETTSPMEKPFSGKRFTRVFPDFLTYFESEHLL